LSLKIGHSLDPLLLTIYRIGFRNKSVNPNTFTLWGLVTGIGSSVLIATDRFMLGGAVLLISGFLDLLDGAVARNMGTVTGFGGFLDSVFDRYTDLLVMCGISVHFMRVGSTFYAVATFIASIGIALIPYTRARAEAASLPRVTGFLERAERLILLLIGLFFGVLPYVIIVLAVLTHVAVISRIIFIKKTARG
jgi:CDP-diacylglycerol---glycerol-3-phosphate 3-phosphatidyltransferase